MSQQLDGLTEAALVAKEVALEQELKMEQEIYEKIGLYSNRPAEEIMEELDDLRGTLRRIGILRMENG